MDLDLDPYPNDLDLDPYPNDLERKFVISQGLQLKGCNFIVRDLHFY